MSEIKKHRNNAIIPISSIIGDRFHIPSYQRGYRWTRSQVEDLLSDISEFLDGKGEGDFYCLQPLVVRKVSDGEGNPTLYRVIDGQQRLTTIWLILLSLDLEERFGLDYERPTRLGLIKDYSCGDEYCKDIANYQIWNLYVKEQWEKLASDEKNVELYHLFASKLFIQNWFHKNGRFPGDFMESVRFIWHDIEDEAKELTTFENLNSGKIPLTNAELIKALFLGTFGAVNTEGKLRQNLLAEEFDEVERRLREDDFWFFLNPDPKPTSCIGFIFELMQSLRDKEHHDKQEYSTYFYFRDEIGEKHAGSKAHNAMDTWNWVMQIFHVLEGWYGDPEIYNLIGYLRAFNLDIKSIFQQYEALRSKSEFRDYLKARCMKSVVWESEMDDELLRKFRYDSNKDKTNRLLLLLNIAMLGNQHTSEETGEQNRIKDITKFSFKDYHNCNWHIEHISPNNAAYAECMRDFVGEPHPIIGAKLKDVLNNEQKEKTDPFIAVLEDSVMSLSNLTLLSSHINESIGRKLFTEKRSIVIRKQTEGYYVPPCTMMVFTKSFTSAKNIKVETESNKFDYWSDIDREEYKKSVKLILVGYFGLKPAEERKIEKAVQPSYNAPCFIDTRSEKTPLSPSEVTGEVMPVMTFSELIKKYDYIVIPKIQRDYAQGRSREEDDGRATQVRTNLLNDIFFCNNEKKTDFQIVFGVEERRQTDTMLSVRTFIPIDGQQRLTTLFLLTLYRDKRWMPQEFLSPKFIYETRHAATDFCIAVTINEWYDFPTEIPSKAITGSVWFMDYWKQDPTVMSMLNMLDDIHKKSPTEYVKYPNLENIEFSFFDLGRHNISENIYLKMNSRGKPLTSFENLKAEIEKRYSQQLPVNWKQYIDTTWLDSFWATSKPTRLPDEGFLRYIANFLFIKMCEKSDFDKKVNEDKTVSQLEKISDLSSGKFVSSVPFIEAFGQVGFENLAQLLSIKSKNSWDDLIAPAWGWKNDDAEWRSVLDSSYTRRTVMYAIMLNAAYQSDLKDWLRFAWNMARNTVTNFETFCDCCKLFQKLEKIQHPKNSVQPSRSLLDVLCSEESKALSSNQQYVEERIKASKHTDERMFSLILDMERYAFFEGAIRSFFHSEEKPWIEFEKKCARRFSLIPVSQSERAIMCNIIKYIPDDKIPEVFHRDYLSFDDSNLRSIFLFEKNRNYIEQYLLEEEVSTSGFAEQLISLAKKLVDDSSKFYIRTDWEVPCILTYAEKRNGWKYRYDSFVLKDNVYVHIVKLLRHDIPGVKVSEANIYERVIVRGTEIDFTFQHHYFRYYATNHTIGLMGRKWNDQFLGHQSDKAHICILTLDDTQETLKSMLENMVDYAKTVRKECLDKFVTIFTDNNLIPNLYGYKDNTDIPIQGDEGETTFFEWITIAHHPSNAKWLCAVTLRNDMHIEVGLRKAPEDLVKDEDTKKNYQLLGLGSLFSTKNDWWYGVRDFNFSEESEALKQLRNLIHTIQQNNNS